MKKYNYKIVFVPKKMIKNGTNKKTLKKSFLRCFPFTFSPLFRKLYKIEIQKFYYESELYK